MIDAFKMRHPTRAMLRIASRRAEKRHGLHDWQSLRVERLQDKSDCLFGHDRRARWRHRLLNALQHGNNCYSAIHSVESIGMKSRAEKVLQRNQNYTNDRIESHSYKERPFL